MAVNVKLVLIRHPQPEVASGICYGKTDLLLREPATASALEISARVRAHPSAIVQAPSHMACSPLQRCAQLGQALATMHPSAALTFDARLQELDFGAWEMQPWDSIGKAPIDAWIASGFDAHHGGESLQALDSRVASWLQDAQKTDAAHQTLWVITHAGVIRSILRQQRICSFNESLAWPIDYGRSVAIQDSNLLWSNT
jgi:alpha-ribazole phosphatase